MTTITPFQLYVGMIISGVLSGVGVAIGMYLANKYLLTNTERMIQRLETQVSLISKRIKREKKRRRKAKL